MTKEIIILLAWVEFAAVIAMVFASASHILEHQMVKLNTDSIESVWSIIWIYVVLGLEIVTLPYFYEHAKGTMSSLAALRDIALSIAVILAVIRFVYFTTHDKEIRNMSWLYFTISMVTVFFFGFTFMVKSIAIICIM